MDNDKTDADHYHYRSIEFRVGLAYSRIIFDWTVYHRYYRGPRLEIRTPPNTPTEQWFFADYDDQGYDADDEYDEFDEYDDHDYRPGDHYDWPEELYDWEEESTACAWSVGYNSDI